MFKFLKEIYFGHRGKNCGYCGAKLSLFTVAFKWNLTKKKTEAGELICNKCDIERMMKRSGEKSARKMGISLAEYEARQAEKQAKAKESLALLRGEICPECKSHNIQSTSKDQGLSVSKGCLGGALLGPIGLLCSACGKSKQVSEDKKCLDCGKKF